MKPYRTLVVEYGYPERMNQRLGIVGLVALCLASYGAAFGEGKLKSASGEASSEDREMKELGEMCLQAETDWKQSCGCSLSVMYDLTPPTYKHSRLFNDDQRLKVKHVCRDIVTNIPRVCKKEAAAMCKMKTLALRRVDVDTLTFTLTGTVGNGQINYDEVHVNMDMISQKLTGRRQ